MGARGPTIGGMSAADLHHRLRLLELEKREAQHIGLITNELPRMADVLREILEPTDR